MRDDEPGNHQKNSIASTLVRFTWIVAIALVVYVVSIGPVSKICLQGTGSPKTFFVIYAPLDSLAQHSYLFKYALERYLNFWDTNYLQFE